MNQGDAAPDPGDSALGPLDPQEEPEGADESVTSPGIELTITIVRHSDPLGDDDPYLREIDDRAAPRDTVDPPVRGRRRRPWGAVDQFLSAATNSIAVLVASHRLGDDDFGRLAIAIVIAMIVVSTTRAFTSMPFVLEHAADPPRRRRRTLTAAFAGAFRVGGAVAAACVLAGLLLGGELGHLLVLLGLGVVVLVLQDLARFAFFVVGPSWGAALSDAIWFAVFLVPALLLPDQVDSAESVLTLWILGAAVGGAAAAVVLRRSAVPTRRGWRSPWVRAHRSLSLNALGDTVLVTVYGYSIPLILAGLESVADAGAYRLAQTLVGPVMILVSGLTLDLLPRLVQAHRRGAPVTRAAARAGTTIALMALAVGVGAVAVPDAWMSAVVGERWIDIEHLTVVLAVSASATAIGTSALLALRATGGQALITRVRALFFPVNLLLVVAGTAVWGAMGAAVGLLIGNALSIGPWWWLTLRHVRLQRA